MKSIATLLVVLGCSLVCYQTTAWTGVTVVGDVYMVPEGQVRIHAAELTLEADHQGSGNVIMAAHTWQRINAEGHRVNRLTIKPPVGVDVVSDLVVTTALAIPLGALRLIDAWLIVPNDSVIAVRDLSCIHRVGWGALLIKSLANTLFARTGTSTETFDNPLLVKLVTQIFWLGTGSVAKLSLPVGSRAFATGVGGQVPAPPPKAASFFPHGYTTPPVLTA